jgi:hypothetical protein
MATLDPNQSYLGETPRSPWHLQERLAVGGYFESHVTQFANYPVREWALGNTEAIQPTFAYALSCPYEDEDAKIRTYLDELLGVPNSQQLQALVFGPWAGDVDVCTGDASSQALVEYLATIQNRLPQLKAIFIGDILQEESEISWIVQSNIAPVLAAYPNLEVLQVRGGESLRLQPLGVASPARHDHLQALILETGGLSRETLQDIYAWELPALNHLELWFGSTNYGGDCWVEDLAPILETLKFPHLAYLGLRNSGFGDEMIDMLVQSPLLARLQVLDISLGTLTDIGAKKLLDCPATRELDILNVAENYLSEAMLEQLHGLGLQVIDSEQRQEEDEEDPAWRRYCAVSE